MVIDYSKWDNIDTDSEDEPATAKPGHLSRQLCIKPQLSQLKPQYLRPQTTRQPRVNR